MKVTRTGETHDSIFPKTISVPFPDKKYAALLQELEIDKKKTLDFDDHKKIFVNAIFLFLKGDWSQDELSSIASEFWFSKENKDDEFATALYKCSELTFYIRNIYNPLSPGQTGNFVWFMNTTIKFYEKNFNEVVLK